MKKYSKQRELVENVVKQNRIHPTAEQVYLMLRQDNPNISLGTVYRNLKVLNESGVIKKINMPNAKDRFDFAEEEHYHIICDVCKGVFDVELSLLDELDEKIEKKTGVKVTAHQLIINGVCEKCREGE